MSQDPIYKVPDSVAKSALIDAAKYDAWYKQSVDDPDAFWGEHGKRIDWIKPFTKVRDVDFTGDVKIEWFGDGTLNVAANCLDRHLAERGDQVAIIWEGDDPSDDKKITYKELHEQVCRFANAMKARGVKKGDRISIYLPMIPEAAVAMLACARLGAIHSIVFGGFSPDALAGRIQDCGSTVIITSDEGLRGGRKVPLKKNADEALKDCPTIHTQFVVKRTGGDVAWAATSGSMRAATPHRLIARRKRFQPKIRCSSSTPPAPRANRRAFYTPRAAISSTPR